MLIRISIWIRDRIEGFCTIARWAKPPPNIVLPPGEYSGKIENVCVLWFSCVSSWTLSTCSVAGSLVRCTSDTELRRRSLRGPKCPEWSSGRRLAWRMDTSWRCRWRCILLETFVDSTPPISTYGRSDTIRYDTIYYLHWKTDRQAASLI